MHLATLLPSIYLNPPGYKQSQTHQSHPPYPDAYKKCGHFIPCHPLKRHTHQIKIIVGKYNNNIYDTESKSNVMTVATNDNIP